MNHARGITIGWKQGLTNFIAMAMSVFFVYTLQFRPMEPLIVRSVFVFCVCSLAILRNPGWFKVDEGKIHPVDIALLILNLVTVVYTIKEAPDLVMRVGISPTKWDLVMGSIVILLSLECARRSMGPTLSIFGAVVVAYSFFGQYVPGLFKHPGFKADFIVSYLYSVDGVYGIPLGITLSYVLVFVIFGAFLETCGGGRFFLELAQAMVGRMRGGPAKMAIVASSLFGTINGTPAANVVGTGVVTIPLMRNTGYKPNFAAAVEAAASTGGQIMPPIMGAAAFLMAQILLIPYSSIVIASIIPAILYYVAVFIQVDLRAQALNLSGLPAEQVPNVKDVLLKGGHLIVPLVVLVWALVIQKVSPPLAASYGIVACILASWVRKETRIGPIQFIRALQEGGLGVEGVGTCVAVASVIVGVFAMTGLGINIASMIFYFSRGILPLALLCTAVVALVLGVGLPTSGSYLICAATVAPAIVRMGVPKLSAHLFALYFANISNVTPPVALAAYAAAGIAKCDPLKVGVQAFKLSIGGFIIPFMFVYGSALLAQGSVTTIIWSFVTALIGVFALSVATEGFFAGKNLSICLRLVLTIGALNLIHTGPITDAIGILIVASVLFIIPAVYKKINARSHSI